MNVFKGQNFLEFFDLFKTDEDCKEYLANIKAQSPFKFSRCNHTACQTRSDFSRQCNICRHTESQLPTHFVISLSVGNYTPKFKNDESK